MKKKLKKSSSLHLIMLIIWTILIVFLIPTLIKEYGYSGIWYIDIVLTLNFLFLIYFWLNGVKDVMYVLCNYLNMKYLRKYDYEAHAYPTIPNARVDMLYCTCDDFNGAALEKCMHQTHKKCRFVILDDSRKDEYITEIDSFIKSHPGTLLQRRVNHHGFKAGNLNDWISTHDDYDFFAILDSDEIVPDNFVEDCLKFFNYYSNIGIVQCSHKSTGNINKFMELFHIGVDSHWPVYQSVKHTCGFMSMLGHGAMISRVCAEKSGWFDEVVAEDLIFTIKIRNNGYFCAFNITTVCEEEYPIDYFSFKKRHNKWTQGNMELIKSYTKVILTAKMHWWEKLDIFLFTYNLPLTAFFSLYIVINIAILPLLGYQLHYPLWLLFPTIIFFFAPMANDFIMYTFIKETKLPLYHVIFYMFSTFILYGSMLFVSLKASLLGMFGKKAVFLVTPKKTRKIKFIEAVKINTDELIFALALSIISIACSKSILPVIILIVPAVFSVWLTMYSNSPSYKEKNNKCSSGC